MLGLLVAYAWYYVCRYSLTYVGPELVRSQGLDMRDVGFLTSVCQITIGLSKLGGSILTADMSPSVTLALGLVLAALCNLAAAAVPAGSPAALVPALGVIWALNGLWQGFGSPACARIIDAWCRPEERGTFWSVWNTSNNIGGALAPIIAGAGVAWAGWRGGLLLAGASALGAAGLVLLLARDAPGGAPAGPRGARRGRRAAPGTVRLLLLAQGRGARAGPGAGGQLASLGSSAGRWSLLWAGCLRQPGIVRLACANFLIYGIRGAVVSWLAFFMLHTGRGLASAAALLSTFEVGGLFGSFLGGVVSDLRLRGRAAAPVVGLRVDTSLLALVTLLLPSLAAIWLLPPSAGAAWLLLPMFAAGLGLYVVQALTALCGLELVPKRAIGVSQGFLGLTAYVGAAASGLPLGWLIQGRAGWVAWQAALLLAALGTGAVLLPLRRARSHQQRLAPGLR